MKFEHKGSKINYLFIDKKSDVVDVYLHGWGADLNAFLFCKDVFKRSCLFVDFPPFGKSAKDIVDWTIFTYTTMLVSLCEKLKIKKANLIGHSFGGRVACLFAVFCKSRTNKLVLVSSAGLKPRRTLLYYIKIMRYKFRKKLNLNTQNFGSTDYRILPENMKVIFKNILRVNLDDYISNIEAETLIVFGKNDKTTPVYMAKRFHKKIKNSKLIILNGGHFCFDDDRYRFLDVLYQFLKV